LNTLKAYKELDEASADFSDPLVMTQVLLRQKIFAVNKKLTLADCVRFLVEKSNECLKNGSVVYAVVREIRDAWIARALIAGDTVVALLLENPAGRVSATGMNAYTELFTEIFKTNPEVKLNAGSIANEELSSTLKKHVNKALSAEEAQPPGVWVGKYLYGFLVENIVSDKGGYMYVLLGRDKHGRTYAVKVLREKTADGKQLAMGGSQNSIVDAFKGVVNALEVSLLAREDVKQGLEQLGHDESLADTLLAYKKYILKPRAIMLPRDVYSSREYVEYPPLVLEDYADLGDLASHSRKNPLDDRELLFIGIRVAGALALIHTAQLLHMDVKPQNILLATDESEPYGYAPLLGDFVGSPHIYGREAELKKSTPEYADPLSLIRGKASFSYDTYSLGVTLCSVVLGERLWGRVLANLVILKELYGMDILLKAYLAENPGLARYLDSLVAVIRDYKAGRIPYPELVSSMESLVEDIDKSAFEKLSSKLPQNLVNVLAKAVSLRESTRYRDGVLLWKDLVDTAKKLGYLNLIPRPPITA